MSWFGEGKFSTRKNQDSISKTMKDKNEFVTKQIQKALSADLRFDE